MLISSIIIALILALFFASLLSYAFKRRAPGPAGGIVFMFFVIFLFTWVIGMYMEPIGPVNWGVSWLGYLLAAFLIMLLLGAVIPPRTPRDRIVIESGTENIPKTPEPTVAEITIGFFFWIMILGLLALALYRIFS